MIATTTATQMVSMGLLLALVSTVPTLAQAPAGGGYPTGGGSPGAGSSTRTGSNPGTGSGVGAGTGAGGGSNTNTSNTGTGSNTGSGGGPGASAGHSFVAGADYRLAAGDTVHIEVLNPGAEQFSTDVTVNLDGTVRTLTVPPVTVRAAGYTVKQFQDAAYDAYSKFIRRPSILVTLKYAHAPTVYLWGYFGKTGPIELDGEQHALDLVALAGGAPQGDLSQVTLTRGHLTRKLDLLQALHSPGSADNVILQPQDELFAPLSAHVIVQGEVRTPGSFPLNDGMGLQDLILMAGGLTDNADLSQIHLTRADGQQVGIDLKKTVLSGTRDLTVLKSGDVVTIPELPQPVVVAGEVNHPVSIPFRSDLTLQECLTLAGGETPLGDLGHVKIAHTRPFSMQTIVLIGPLKDSTAAQLPIHPGELIMVPPLIAQVFALGWVDHPGPLLYHTGMKVLDVVAAAGDSETGDLAHVTLARASGQRLQVDVQSMLRNGSTRDNLDLDPGDALYVPELPESQRVIFVLGAVLHPGTTRFRPGMTVLDALSGGDNLDSLHTGNNMGASTGGTNAAAFFGGASPQALNAVNNLGAAGSSTGSGSSAPGAGLAENADIEHVVLNRGHDQQQIDVAKIIRGGDTSQNVTMQAGDSLYVPEIPDDRRMVFVLGAVTHPGPVPFREGLDILDVLNGSGGGPSLAEIADGAHVVVNRADGTRLEVNLDRLIREGDTTHNVVLKRGDVVYVPEIAESKYVVTVLGAVAHPGPVPFRAGMQVLDALNASSIGPNGSGDSSNQAGGILPSAVGASSAASQSLGAGGDTRNADLAHVMLTRADGQQTLIDVVRIARGGDMSLNVRLERGDTLYVPESKAFIYVLGAVNKPGIYTLRDPEKNRVLDVIEMAGGLTQHANFGKAELVQYDSGKPVVTPLRLDKLQKGDLGFNLPVPVGSVIYIPSRQDPNYTGIAAALSLAEIVRLFVP